LTAGARDWRLARLPWSVGASAAEADTVGRHSRRQDNNADLIAPVRKGLFKSGYQDGQNAIVQYRGADGIWRWSFADDGTTTVPIVFNSALRTRTRCPINMRR